MRKVLVLWTVGLVALLAGCNMPNNVQQPVQKKLIEPVKKQVVSWTTYSQEDVNDALNLVKEILK